MDNDKSLKLLDVHQSPLTPDGGQSILGAILVTIIYKCIIKEQETHENLGGDGKSCDEAIMDLLHASKVSTMGDGEKPPFRDSSWLHMEET